MVPPRWIFLFLVLFLTTSAPTAAQQDSSAAPLDLAAMTLSPADLAAAGWDDLGLTAGQSLSVVDLAERAVWPTGAGPERDGVRDALLAAGWQQAYTATFATFWAPNRADLGRQVEVEIVAYADDAGAATGFALVPDVFPTGQVELVTDTFHFMQADQASAWLQEQSARLVQGAGVACAAEDDVTGVGDEAIAVTLALDPEHDGLEVTHVAAVLFRSGAVVAVIRLTRIYDPPPASAAREFAAAQASCLAAVACLRPLPAPVSLSET